MYKRPRRRWRRLKRKIPLYAFLLAVLAFIMAFAFPPEDETPAQPAPVYPLSSLVEQEPPAAPAPASVEPEIPSGPAVDKSAWNLKLVNTWNPYSQRSSTSISLPRSMGLAICSFIPADLAA